MPDFRDVVEYREQHPNVRIWGVAACSDEPVLGDYPVIPFDDHVAEVERVRKAEHERVAALMTACLERNAAGNPLMVFGLLFAMVPAIGWAEAMNRARGEGDPCPAT